MEKKPKSTHLNTIESVFTSITSLLATPLGQLFPEKRSNINNIALRLSVLLFIAFPACFILSKVVGKISRKKLGAHIGILIQKILLYGGIIAVIITILLELGFNLGALLGAAGIMSVAVGFASQTSLSNIIIGVFLYGEKPFGVGDVIRIGDKVGAVLSIDLLSVKLRLFNNEFVRIPNETMIKTEVTNVTKFPNTASRYSTGTSIRRYSKKKLTSP